MSKVFVTVGNDFHSFHRLVKAVDELGRNIGEHFTVQYGYSSYIPQHVQETYKFLDRKRFYKVFADADLIISHAGIGNMIDVVRHRKKMITVPRRREFNEHFNNHQLEIAAEIDGKYENIKVLYDVDNLGEIFITTLAEKVNYQDPPDIEKLDLIKDIKEFIGHEGKK